MTVFNLIALNGNEAPGAVPVADGNGGFSWQNVGGGGAGGGGGGSSFGWSRTVVGADYNATTTDYVIAVVDTSVPRTITLADPGTLQPGQQVIVKDESGGASTNAIMVVGVIDGVTQIPIQTNYGLVWVYSTGAFYAALSASASAISLPAPLSPPTIS